MNQQSFYSEDKRAHCLVYLTISTPDRFILYLHGPQVGRRHYMTLYENSGLDDALYDELLINGEEFFIYGDAAFLIRPGLKVGFNRAFSTPEKLAFNAAMSVDLEAVEWGYKSTKQQFTTLYKRRMLNVR